MSLPAFPQSSYYEQSAIYNGYLYAIGGVLGSSGTNAVYYTNITSQGAGVWHTYASYPSSIYSNQCSAYENNLYCIGGYNGTTFTNGTYYIPTLFTTTNSFTWNISRQYSGNTIEANAVVSDSAYAPEIANSTYTKTLTVKGLTSVQWGVSNSVIDSGQSQTLSSGVIGCVASYGCTYNFSIYNQSGTLVANAIYTAYSESNAFTFVQNPSWGTGTFTANIIVTDSALSFNTASNSLTYKADSAMSAPSISEIHSVSSTTYPGELIGFSSAWSGGTAPYTAVYTVSNSVSNAAEYGAIAPQTTATSGNFSFTVPASYTGSGFRVNVTVIDNATSHSCLNSTRTATFAAGAIPVPSQFPSNIQYYYPIVISNYQDAPTPQGFQQKVSYNANNYTQYEASNLQNIEFFYANGTVIPSWLEGDVTGHPNLSSLQDSNLTYFLRLANAIDSYSSGIIYVGFAPKSINLFNGNTVGEAPQLSPQYGQYDNGADVFGNYWDFAGTSLPSAFSATDNLGYIVNNGLSVTAGAIYSKSQEFASLNTILETYAAVTSPTPISYSGLTQSSSQAPQGSNGGSAAEILYVTSGTSSIALQADAGDGTSASYNLGSVGGLFTPMVNQYYILGSAVSPTDIYEYKNYTTVGAVAGTFNTNQYIILGWFGGSSAGTSSSTQMNFQWVRTRDYPPNGVMPSESTGALRNATSSFTISIPVSTYQSVTQGINSTIAVSASGGSAPYTYQWFEEPPNAFAFTPIIGAVSNLFTVATSNSTPLGVYRFEVKATDSGIPPVSLISTPASIGVNSSSICINSTYASNPTKNNVLPLPHGVLYPNPWAAVGAYNGFTLMCYNSYKGVNVIINYTHLSPGI